MKTTTSTADAPDTATVNVEVKAGPALTMACAALKVCETVLALVPIEDKKAKAEVTRAKDELVAEIKAAMRTDRYAC